MSTGILEQDEWSAKEWVELSMWAVVSSRTEANLAPVWAGGALEDGIIPARWGSDYKLTQVSSAGFLKVPEAEWGTWLTLGSSAPCMPQPIGADWLGLWHHLMARRGTVWPNSDSILPAG